MSSFASPYIKTVTVAVARNADLLTYNLGSMSNTLGTLYGEVLFPVSTTSNKFLVGSTTVGNSPAYQGSGGYRGYDGTNAPLFVAGMDVANIRYKFASVWDSTRGKMSGSLNGTVSAETAFDGSYNFTDIQIGGGNGSNALNSPIRNVRIWNRALSSSELQAITA